MKENSFFSKLCSGEGIKLNVTIIKLKLIRLIRTSQIWTKFIYPYYLRIRPIISYILANKLHVRIHISNTSYKKHVIVMLQ